MTLVIYIEKLRRKSPAKKRRIEMMGPMREEIFIFQLITGKCPLSMVHLANIGKVAEGTCPGCSEVPDSIQHLILDCLSFSEAKML